MKLQDYLESERQWPRNLRMGHAQYQAALARKANNQEQVEFWEAVFEANTRQSWG